LITKHDLDEAIKECEGKRNPDANTCLKLAAFYTIRKEMFGEGKEVEQPMYSYAPPPESVETIQRYGDSEFLEVVEGKPIDGVMLIMDELMDSMRVLQPRIYDSVMRKVLNL